ncbi:MAG: chemotaxis protein CheW [Candidatus Methylomirabilales bacterium]
MSSSTLDTTIQGSVLRLVVFGIEAQQYALPLSAVERAFPMVAVSPLPKAPAIALGVINVSGQVVPVVDIRKRFGFPPRAVDPRARLLVARTPRRTLAIPVDTVMGVKEVMAETVTAPDAVLPGIGHVAGIVTLPEGLLFIHDLDTFLSLEEERQLAEALEEAER